MDYTPLKEAEGPDVIPLSMTSGSGEMRKSAHSPNITESLSSSMNGGSGSKISKRNIRSLTKSSSNLEEPLTGDIENGHHFEATGEGNQEPISNGSYSKQHEQSSGPEPNGLVGNDDPYYVFKDDLLRKLGAIDDCLASYKRVVMSTDTAVNTYEVKEMKKQLKRHIKHAESTLKDLETTIRLVERQRQKFSNINDAELYERQSFVSSSQTRISSAKQSMNSEEFKDKIADDERRLAVRRAGGGQNNSNQTEREKENTAFLVDQSTQSQLMLRQQDETLDDLDDAVVRVSNMADGIHEELQNQNKMLDDLDDDLHNLEEQLGFVMGKLGKFLKTKNKCQLGTILLLCLIVIVLFFLVIYWH